MDALYENLCFQMRAMKTRALGNIYETGQPIYRNDDEEDRKRREGGGNAWIV